MIVAGRQLRVLAAALALSFMGSMIASAAGWRDDFTDGSVTDNSPVPWVTNIGGFFPGDYNATSGDFVLTPAADGFAGSQMSAFVPIGFTDTYVRTQGIVLPNPDSPPDDGGNLVLTARVDPNTLSGYLMYFDVSGNLNLQLLVGGASSDIGVTFDAPFNAGTEVIIELNVIGSELSGYAWAADDPNGKPTEPQVTATDTTFTSGIAGIAFAEDDDGTIGVFRYVAAQDTPFIDGSNGDFDDDGDVDGDDFLVWQRGLGLTGQLNATTGDADGDHDVDAADLAIWKANFGVPQAGGAVSAVPEPASLATLVSGLLAIAGLRAQNRRR